jgi:hypothetical protein
MTADRPTRVVLIREGDAGAGCCGQIADLCEEPGSAEHYRRTRADMHAMGVVYRALRAEFTEDQVAVEVVDPRNTAWLVPTLARDARRRGLRGRDVWRLVVGGIRQHAVVVDGLLVHPGGTPPDPTAVVAAVRRQVAAA